MDNATTTVHIISGAMSLPDTAPVHRSTVYSYLSSVNRIPLFTSYTTLLSFLSKDHASLYSIIRTVPKAFP